MEGKGSYINGEVCCILGVCCPPAQRKIALAKELTKDLGAAPSAEAVAEWVFHHFDLAPAGTLQPLTEAIAAHARKASGAA